MGQLTNVRMIRGENAVEKPAPVAETVRRRICNPEDAGSIPVRGPLDPFERRDRIQALIEAWRAPVVSEETIETWAKQYELCPKVETTFVEWLIARGVGE